MRNVDRTVGTMLGSEITRHWGRAGLPDDTVRLRFTGSAGQSFGAFIPPGLTLELEGDTNDYVGKGLSGGRIVVRPPEEAPFKAHENVIAGNVALYGATAGEAFIRGVAGERFAVRNSGAVAVVEGVGDHGCEYMTGGRVLVIGRTGRNFAAGMSGGVAWVFDPDGTFAARCNTEMVGLEPLADDAEDTAAVHELLVRHRDLTGSERATQLLENWSTILPCFVRVVPHDYRRVLDAQARMRASGMSVEEAEMAAFEENARDLARVGGGLMGRPTGFIEIQRRGQPARPPLERIHDWSEAHPRLSDERARGPGRAVHGLRDPVLPHRRADQRHGLGLPDQQPDPRVERPRLPRPVARGVDPPPPDEQLPRVHRAASARRRARGRARSGSTATRWRSRRSSRRSPTGPGTRAGSRRPRRSRGPGTGSRSSAPGPRASSAADQLNKAGHHVTVFERAGRVGGLLMYGIPNMKLDKDVVVAARRPHGGGGHRLPDRRHGRRGRRRGRARRPSSTPSCSRPARPSPATCPSPGRELGGIHLAMSYLRGNTRRLLDGGADAEAPIDAAGKDVLVIGGGDTGTDCVGTAIRQGARSVRQLELLGRPPLERAANNPWPEWPKVYKLDYGQEEAQALWGEDPRRYSTTTRRFIGRNEHVTGRRDRRPVVADRARRQGRDARGPGHGPGPRRGPRAAGARVPRAGARAPEGVRLRAGPARQRAHRRRTR